METVLMLGDSLIEWGDWDTLLPDYRTINRGYAGETVVGLAGRLADEIEKGDNPSRVIIMSGTNDLLMGDQSFTAVFETMLPRLKQLCQGADVLVIGLAPMQMIQDSVEVVNSRLEEIVLQSGCRFLDIVEPFHLHCRPVGNPCFFMDGVHFSPHGYRVLANAISEALKQRPDTST